MDEVKLTEDQANAVYDILVQYCGASSDEHDQYSFMYHQTTGCREYRFMGNLGFGGRFWNLLREWSVNCYTEDVNPERQVMIDEANKALKGLRESYGI